MDRKTDRHGWLRAALAGRGHMQKDVATAWQCDDAVVSRFIKTGEPELTWDRANTLAFMLNMNLDELKLRLEEGLEPRRRSLPAPRGPAETNGVTHGEQGDTVKDAIENMRQAVATVKGLLPTARVSVTIEYNGNH